MQTNISTIYLFKLTKKCTLLGSGNSTTDNPNWIKAKYFKTCYKIGF